VRENSPLTEKFFDSDMAFMLVEIAKPNVLTGPVPHRRYSSRRFAANPKSREIT
jgi:hypothetical protein